MRGERSMASMRRERSRAPMRRERSKDYRSRDTKEGRGIGIQREKVEE